MNLSARNNTRKLLKSMSDTSIQFNNVKSRARFLVSSEKVCFVVTIFKKKCGSQMTWCLYVRPDKTIIQTNMYIECPFLIAGKRYYSQITFKAMHKCLMHVKSQKSFEKTNDEVKPNYVEIWTYGVSYLRIFLIKYHLARAKKTRKGGKFRSIFQKRKCKWHLSFF